MKKIITVGIISLSLLIQGTLLAANKRIALTTAITKPHYATHIDDKFLKIGKDPKRVKIGYKLQYQDGSSWITSDEGQLIYEKSDVNTFVAKHDAHDFTVTDLEEFILQELIDSGMFAGTIQ